MSRQPNRFAPSVESLEAREVPSGVSGRITGVAVGPAPGAVVPTGTVTFTVDGAQPAAASDGRKFKMLVAPLILEVDGDVARTGPFFDFDADRLMSGADQIAGALLIARQRALREFVGGADSIWIDIPAPIRGEPARHFNGFVSRISAGDANEAITIGGPQVELSDLPRPPILLQRLANPGLPDAGPHSFTTDPRGSGL